MNHCTRTAPHSPAAHLTLSLVTLLLAALAARGEPAKDAAKVDHDALQGALKAVAPEPESSMFRCTAMT